MSEVPPDVEIPVEVRDVEIEEEASSSLIYLVVMYSTVLLAAIGGAAYYFLVVKKKDDKKKGTVDVDEVMSTNSVGLKDITYLASKLNPDSTHMDVMWVVATTPENVAYGLKAYNSTLKVKKERITQDLEEAKKSSSKTETKTSENLFDFDDEGWADEDEDDEKAKLAAKTEEEKRRDMEQLKKAVGKNKVLLEGLDKGVLGQKWVEKVLTEKGVWPPKTMKILDGVKFEYEGKEVSPMDHPGLRRNLCMITGRLNSMFLNGHPELLEAGSKQLVDQTYFKGSMEFRGRCALLLEAALRTSVACRNYKLAKTIVELVGMFKIGVDSPNKVDWFNAVMQKQYQCLPRLKIENTSVECPEEKEMATGDVLALGLELTRLHAEPFTRQKIAMFQKQGIPPQVALQTYREGWWFLVRCERLDGETPAAALPLRTDGLLQELSKEDLSKFETAKFEERLLTAWPMMVQNVAQKSGKVKIQFLAPSVPGKYKFTVSVKSQDFLGADQEFSVEGTIVDASSVVRKPKEKSKDEEADPQTKKEN